jgi:hypothetical protein
MLRNVSMFFLIPMFVLYAQDKDWAKKGKSDKFSEQQFMQAVGVGTSEDEARNQAFLNLAKIIEVKITGEMTSTSSETLVGNKGEASSRTTEKSQERVNLDLQGLRIEDTDFNKKKKTYYALAVLDRGVAGNAMRAEITNHDKTFRTFLEQGKVLFDTKSFYEAVDKMQTCINELNSLVRIEKKLRIVQPDAAFEEKMVAKSDEVQISRIIDGIAKDEAGSNLDVVTALTVYKLYRSFGENINNTSIVIGNFSYQDTKMTSAFTAYFKDKLEVELSKISGMKVIGSKDVSLSLKSKGIEYDGTAQGLAAVSGADATLIGSYWELDDHIEIRAQIISKVVGAAMASANMTFSSKLIPKSISCRPDNFSQIQADLALLRDDKANSDLKVVVWTDRGDGGVYKEKEKLVVYVKANKDCYVKVIYHDALGNNIQVFPNELSAKHEKITANTVYTIGGKDSKFEFQVSEPYGTELIKAFASTEPFAEFDKSDVEPTGNGLFVLKRNTKDMLAQVKGIPTAKKDTEYAESSVSLTTVKDLK